MKKNLTELVFVLDRSGSMGGLESDTIGGYNAMLKEQRETDGEAFITTVLFDDGYELLHDHINLNAAKPITEKEYFIRCSYIYNCFACFFWAHISSFIYRCY